MNALTSPMTILPRCAMVLLPPLRSAPPAVDPIIRRVLQAWHRKRLEVTLVKLADRFGRAP